MYFLVNASSQTFGSSNFKFCLCIGHMMSRVLGDVSCDLDPKFKVKGQIIYFLVNTSPHKLSRSSNFKFCLCIGHMMSRVLGNTSCDLDLEVKVK